MASLVQFRRDTGSNWISANPVLAEGELGLNLTDDTFKIGDGATAWNSLSIASGTAGSDGDDGLGWTGATYSGATGIVTFTSTDGLGFTTGDLRGADGVDGTMVDLIDDTTPQLGGDLDCNDKAFKESSYAQIADASLGTGTHTFAFASGDMQQLTATGNITLAFSGFITGKVCTMIIDAVNWGAHTITHPATLEFAGQTAPTYTSAGTDRVMVIKDKDDVYSLFVVGQDIGAV